MKSNQPSATPRGVRVAEQLHQEIAELIRAELKDPRIGMVTATGVEVTPDYAHATVWFTVLPSDDETIADTLSGLRAARGFMRAQLGRRIRIHTTPELKFKHDQSIEQGFNLSKLIDQANASYAKDDQPADQPDDGAPPQAGRRSAAR
jgi:ribosome-binding factor A